MSNIYLNDKLRRNLNAAFFGNYYFTNAGTNTMAGQYGFRNFTRGNPSAGSITDGVIRLMKGTVPTDFSGLTSISDRSSDILVTWSALGCTFANPLTSVDGYGVVDSSAYASASASGVASWFWWYIANLSNVILLQLCGTVGTSGADLIIGDTTIIAGANYRFQNLKFDIPTEYTY